MKTVRTLINLALATITIVLRALGLLRWPPRLVELAYPVIAIRPDHSYAFVADGFRVLRTPTPAWAITPCDGTILIDSDFDIYVEHNVRCTEGDLGRLFRQFVGPKRSASYKIGLRRARHTGPAEAHRHLAACESFPWINGEAATAAARQQIAQQTTMAGIVAILKRHAPIEPVVNVPVELDEPGLKKDGSA
jgi:hypothetical protein